MPLGDHDLELTPAIELLPGIERDVPSSCGEQGCSLCWSMLDVTVTRDHNPAIRCDLGYPLSVLRPRFNGARRTYSAIDPDSAGIARVREVGAHSDKQLRHSQEIRVDVETDRHGGDLRCLLASSSLVVECRHDVIEVEVIAFCNALDRVAGADHLIQGVGRDACHSR